MEALAGGALVLTDPMQPLPVHVHDGKHLLVYKSLGQLKKLIKYYLEHPKERLKIARAGHKVAMTAHRSWHIMERFILGEWLRKHSGKEFLLPPPALPQVGNEVEFFWGHNDQEWQTGRVMKVVPGREIIVETRNGTHHVQPYYERWQWKVLSSNATSTTKPLKR